MERRFDFRRTTILIAGLAAFLAGLGLARSPVGMNTKWLWLSIFLVLVSFKISRLAVILSVALVGLTFGWWRGTMFIEQVIAYDSFYDQQVLIMGVAETDAVYSNNSQLTFDISEVKLTQPVQTSLVGRVKIEGFGALAVYRGDVVRVEGKLRRTLGSRQGRISFAQIEVLERSDSIIENTRHRFVSGMLSALPEPLGSFGLGLLVGQRNTLPRSVSEQLSVVGLTHIIAVSGYNLTILVRGTRRVFSKRSKYQSVVASIALLGVFLLFTGFSPSIVRAAIVSILSLLAWYYGRTFRPVLLLLLTAGLTAGWNPLYIWSDIGWYLSFLAFFGILVVAPLLVRRFQKFFRRQKSLRLLLLETMCAQLMTMPLIMYIFKEFSTVAILSNLLVAPLVPIAMLLALVAGVSGMLIPALAGWLALPAVLLLTYMLDIAALLARVPHALLSRELHLWQMLFLYGTFVVTSAILWRRSNMVSAKITKIR